jgi:peptidyl-tRNA hydrolase
VKHPETIARWHAHSNYLVIVSVPDEVALIALTTRARERGIASHLVHEPDIGDAATALALEPGDAARRLCSSLPLAMRERPALTPREAAMSHVA